jgi:tetratricopeptide (TPR) repeat protein
MDKERSARVAHLVQALEHERGERARVALAALEAFAAEPHDSPELLVHVARGLLVANRATQAEALLVAGLERFPGHAPLHVVLAELRWQRGDGAASTAVLERAIEQHPREMQLRLVAADLLRNMGEAPRALELLQAGLARAPDSAAFLTSIGVVLEGLDRPGEALPYLRAAIPRAQNPAQARRNLVPALLRTGAAAEGLEICDALANVAPDDQMLIAYRSTALRLSGDARHAALCDYARLVRTYRLQPPARYADLAEINARFALELQSLHQESRRPLAQSLRGGTQTQRDLPTDNLLVADFFAMIDAPVRDYIARLQGAPDHPVDRRRRASYRISGSWSVRLEPGGFHIDHVHPQGWLSSAYYVSLPPVADEVSRAAWLKFGEPGVRVGLPPEHFVKPEAGMLVLFPSFFWHGTVPFDRGGGRLTAAFDVLPV